MIDNELKEYLEEMRKETKEQFDMMRKDMDSMKLSIGSMQQDIGSMQQEMDNMKGSFKELTDQMNARFDAQDKEIISIKQSLAVIEVDHGKKIDVLYETRLDNIEREVENALRIQRLETRVQNLEYKQLGI
ncbi:MAG: hypothetical protein J6A29_03035 [Clostridia bacterium]|nr:hypothetical protein [Clostridia bacterium]